MVLKYCPVALSSDAPYGPADPWDTIAAAVARRTAAGVPLGPDEAVDPITAARLFTGRPEAPAVPRTLHRGRRADLVVLDEDWNHLADHPTIAATIMRGEIAFGRL